MIKAKIFEGDDPNERGADWIEETGVKVEAVFMSLSRGPETHYSVILYEKGHGKNENVKDD